MLMFGRIFNSLAKTAAKVAMAVLWTPVVAFAELCKIPFVYNEKEYALQGSATSGNCASYQDAIADSYCGITTNSSYKGIYHILDNTVQCASAVSTDFLVTAAENVTSIGEELLNCLETSCNIRGDGGFSIIMPILGGVFGVVVCAALIVARERQECCWREDEVNPAEKEKRGDYTGVQPEPTAAATVETKRDEGQGLNNQQKGYVKLPSNSDKQQGYGATQDGSIDLDDFKESAGSVPKRTR
jgi:hypothetical protein